MLQLPTSQALARALLGGGAAAYVGPLDLVPNAAAAYSVSRLLRAAYTGPLVRLREDAGNTESDFSALANGNLDTAAVTAFLAGASGFITKIYDQSGTTRHVVQATAAAQPLYVASGAAGKPVARFDGTDDFMAVVFALAQPMTLLAVNKMVALPAGSYDLVGFASGATAEFYVTPGGNLKIFGSAGVGAGSIGTAATRVCTGILNGASSQTFLDGTATAAAGNAGAGTFGGVSLSHNNTDATFLNNDLSELILYGSALSSGDRATVERNQGTFYGITVA